MSDIENGIFITRDCGDEMPASPQDERDVLRALPDTRTLHDDYLGDLPVFHYLERGLKPARAGAPEAVRIAAWNLERCAHVPPSSALLKRAGADVCFLSEMDVGMARTGQSHTPRGVVGPLGHEFLYGVEFLELGLGSAREKRLNAGKSNHRGFHGNVLSSAWALKDPVMIRFDRDANWFATDCDERRIGGRMAIAAKLPMTGRGGAGGELVLVSAHLESRMTAERRAEQMALLLSALEDYAPGAPMVIGGDLNTDCDAWTLGKGVDQGTPRWADIRERTLEPTRHEPLMARALDAGFAWEGANILSPTVRETPQSGPRRYPDLKLDWFLVRGVTVSNPRTIEAVDDRGTALSDHDLITVDVALG